MEESAKKAVKIANKIAKLSKQMKEYIERGYTSDATETAYEINILLRELDRIVTRIMYAWHKEASPLAINH